jgi:hypothetical protein
MSDGARVSEVDSRRFGKRIARATLSDRVDADALHAFAQSEHIDLAIVRCPVSALAVVHLLEARGYRVMDVLVYYEGATNVFAGATCRHPVRLATRADEEALVAVAGDAFDRYDGHYHADPALDPSLATAGYVEWCVSLLHSAQHETWVATFGDAIMGFIAVKRDPDMGEIALNGVAHNYQRQGVYDSLIKAAGRALHAAGSPRVRVSTHLGNMAPQRVWARRGLTLEHAVYTFHKWFE